MALALVLSLSQCKKNEQNNAENQGEAVTITLDVSGASTSTATDGSRVVVNPNTGTVNFENNDQIIVASGGKYVGTLTYNGSLFTGAISNATEGYPLQFYFLGNVTPAETLTSGVTQSCSVVISDQTEHLPVISAALSNENYTASMTDYTAHLLNKCALVKFNVTTASEAAICVTGFNNKVTVNFAENTLTNGQESNGVITLPAGNGEKWAILLPNEALGAGEQGSAYSQDGVYIGTRGAVPATTENGYLTVGIEVNVTSEVNPGEVPVGAIGGKFTINANGDQVYFSQGNLQYIGSASTPYWKFAEHQWDCLGTTTGQNSANQNVDRDLFGWGTSGWDNGNTYYQPYDYEYLTDWNASDYGYGYGPIEGTSYFNLTGTYANSDWGVYNAITNGGNMPEQWRTLLSDEWSYVLNSRSTLSDIRYAKAVVNEMNGLILLPDNWNTSVYALNYTNRGDAPYSVNEITAEDWTIIEANDAVFLPAAGDRWETSVGNVGYSGHYWSASCNGLSVGTWYFADDRLFIGTTGYRYDGRSVRLVRDVE
jgi:hypothetical protein